MDEKRDAATPQPDSLPPPAAAGSSGHRERLLQKYAERGDYGGGAVAGVVTPYH